MKDARTWRERAMESLRSLVCWGESRPEIGVDVFDRGAFWFRMSCLAVQALYAVIVASRPAPVVIEVHAVLLCVAVLYIALVALCGLATANRIFIWVNFLFIPALCLALRQEMGVAMILVIGEAVIVSIYAHRWGVALYSVGAGIMYYVTCYWAVIGLRYATWIPVSQLSSVLIYRSVLIAGVSGAIGIFGWFARCYYDRLDRSSDESRRTLQRQRALAQVATALTSELNHDRVVALVLKSAVDILGVAAGYVAVRGDNGQSRIVEVQNLPRTLRGRETSPGCKHPSDGEIAAATAKYLGCATAPITIDGTPQGALTVFRADAATTSPEEQGQLDNLAEVASVAIANARLFAERQRKESHLQILNAVGRVLAETLDLNAAVETVRSELSKAMAVDAFFVATYDEAVSEVTIIHLWDDGQLYPPSTFPLAEGITGKAITTKTSVRINIYRDEDDPPGTVWVGNDDRKTQSIIVVPMLREDRVVGALSVQSYRQDAYDAEHEQLVQTVANSVAVALENQRLYEQLRRLSLQDWMTGLGNAHYFYQEMEREIARAERYHHPLSLIMIDSDLLKEINDQFGHAVGDQHVVEVADIIRSETRQADMAIRYAGDEFLVILPETDASSAMVTAERIRQRVERTPLAVNRRNVPVTVSVGVAAYPEHGRDADELFRNVDAALYEAKRAGKNRSSLCAALLKGDGPMPLV